MMTVLLAPLAATASPPPPPPLRCLTIVKPAMVAPFGDSSAAADQADVVSLILARIEAATDPAPAAATLARPAIATAAAPQTAAAFTTPPCAGETQSAPLTVARATG